jgi:hypothetical protein
MKLSKKEKERRKKETKAQNLYTVGLPITIKWEQISVTHSCYIDEILNSLFLTLVRLHVSA